MILNANEFLMYNGIIVIISSIFLFLSYRKGFLRQLLDLISLIASYIVSGFLCTTIAKIVPIYKIETSVGLVDSLSNSLINTILWFILLVILFRIVYWILCWMTRKSSKIKVLSLANHLLGLGLGMIKVFLVLVIVTIFLKLPIVENGSEFVNTGVLVYVDSFLSEVL